MEQQPQAITVDNVCGGALPAAFELSVRKCLANIMDPNTPARAKRQVVMVLTLAPKDDRVTVDCALDCTEKLANVLGVESRLFVGKDEEGTLYALTDDPRQMNIFTPPAPRELPAPIEFKTAK